MTTYTLPPRAVKIGLPTRQELLKIMWTTPAVMVTAILCGTTLALAILCAIVYLASTGNDAAVIGTVIGGIATAYVAVMNARLRAIRDAVQAPTAVKDSGNEPPA